MKNHILRHVFLIFWGILGDNSDYAQKEILHDSYLDAAKNVNTLTPASGGTSSIESLIRIIIKDNFDRRCRDSVFLPLNMKSTSWFLLGYDIDGRLLKTITDNIS